MKSHFLKQNSDLYLSNDSESTEDFTEIHVVVEGLLASIHRKKKHSKPKPFSNKKWKKNGKKDKKLEDLNIRELPFTF